MSIRRATHVRRPSRGQSLVEFALVLPIFFLLLFGLIDGGRLIFANNTVSQAAREAVRLAHVQAPFIDTDPCNAPICPEDEPEFRENVRIAANNMTSIVGTISADDIDVVCDGGATCGQNSMTVTVQITIPIQPIIPLFGFFYPDALAAEATMVIP